MPTIQVDEAVLIRAIDALARSDRWPDHRAAEALNKAVEFTKAVRLEWAQKADQELAKLSAEEQERHPGLKRGLGVVGLTVRIEPRVVITAGAHGSFGADGSVAQVKDAMDRLYSYKHDEQRWTIRPVAEGAIYCG